MPAFAARMWFSLPVLFVLATAWSVVYRNEREKEVGGSMVAAVNPRRSVIDGPLRDQYVYSSGNALGRVRPRILDPNGTNR